MKTDVYFFATPINENASNFKGHDSLIFGYIQDTFIENQLGFELVKVDLGTDQHQTSQDIHASLDKASLVILDLSSHDPNIYYELGYAKALKKNIIQLQNKNFDSLPFDLGHVTVSYDTTTNEGIDQFKKDVLKAVKSPETFDTPLSFYAEHDVEISGRIDDQGIVEP
ncbi:hypothetical protein ATZ33_00375 [Enterococcus silesiacus]|uniref:Nucleoside 2-deoxyribosyltransferase n=1 Tax=Enterococcus silesiacus TaxID=332949 RepID=A0A0S3K6F6_9ENTE|nr:hypothetical protein [Enterococcus silesiacus]ALR99888.1 hypothetical protein ATZ33_00375 [Enterococcus silesiacus]OJG92806.1 hypothetical protein RV15_GL002751 [Enterococcus silesiacus]